MAKKSYLSKEGYNKLIDDLERMMKRRPALSEEIARAREHGDLKENQYEVYEEIQDLLSSLMYERNISFDM